MREDIQKGSTEETIAKSIAEFTNDWAKRTSERIDEAFELGKKSERQQLHTKIKEVIEGLFLVNIK